MTLDDSKAERLRRIVAHATFDDRFDLVREVATGGMGRVVEAIERDSGTRVAVKFLVVGTDRARLVAEADALERLDHPNVVKYLRHGTTENGEPYLAMEWLPGETLAKRLARGPATVDDTLVLGEQLSAALAHAHGRDVVHRDLKPSNVFLVDGRVNRLRLIDFGIAKLPHRNLTRSGQLLGTPGYMAPEQVRGEAGADDRRVDLFALGCVLYEALAGRLPFEGSDVMEMFAKLLLERAPAIDELAPDVPPRLARLVMALLAKQPQKRVGDAELVRVELATIRDSIATGDLDALERRSPAVPIQSRGDFTTRATAPPRPPRRRWPIVLAAGALVAIGGVVIAWLVLRGGSSECTARDTGGCRAQCDDGDAEACYRDGVAREHDDLRGAQQMSERGCTLRHARACYNAAWQLSKLIKASVEPKTSHVHEEQMVVASCELGYNAGCYHAGVEHLTGGTFPPDASRALALLGRGCELDHSQSCTRLTAVIDSKLGSDAERAHAKDIVDAACKRKLARLPCPEN